MNAIWPALILLAVAVAVFTGSMDAVNTALFESAKTSVNLAIGLVGIMAFFLGLMKIAEDAGLLSLLSRALKPLMVRLFPDVPADHPAMGAMILNMAANIMGLANAATPFGIKAMQELDELNQEKGTATNAMCLFLAINTSAVTLLPTGVIGMRASVGSADPAGIFIPTLFATACSTTVAIVTAKFLVGTGWFGHREEGALKRVLPLVVVLVSFIAGALGLVFLLKSAAADLAEIGKRISPWIIPAIIVGIVVYGMARRVKVYECFVEGAKEGFEVALKIIPYLVAILCAVGMLRASTGLDLIATVLDPLTRLVGMPAETLPMALLRPLSGSGAYGVMTEIMNTHGPDSLIGYMVSTFQGSTETTFYVLAVYFGAVRVSRTRFALPAALSADAAGILGAVLICNLLFG
jgi:spore maturation protein SpmA